MDNQEEIEIPIDHQGTKLTLKDGLLQFDNEQINLVAKFEDLKIIEYLTWHEIQCSTWGITLNQAATKQLIELGLKIFPHDQTPLLHFQEHFADKKKVTP